MYEDPASAVSIHILLPAASRLLAAVGSETELEAAAIGDGQRPDGKNIHPKENVEVSIHAAIEFRTLDFFIH
ncbi:MAG: hypothetical protein M3Q08_15515 [Pseudomonadota bacterium]|nr:hypothetical protein [Pseudomonadota bacterium]